MFISAIVSTFVGDKTQKNAITLIRLLTFLLIVVSALSLSARSTIVDLDPYIFGDSLLLSRDVRLVDSLKEIRNKTVPSVGSVLAAQKLGDYFLVHYTDSAFIYWNMARDEASALGLDREAMLLRMKIDGYMPFIGMGAEGYTDFKKIDNTGFDKELKRAYFLASSELYYNLAMKYPDSHQKNRNINKTVEAIDSLMPYYAPDNPVYRYLYAFRNLLTGNKSIAAATLAELLPELRNRPVLYTYAAQILAEFYQSNPNRRDDYMNYLIDATVASLRHGVVRPKLMAQLGRELYLDGDRKRGARCIYLAFSANDAERGLYQLNNMSEYASLLAGSNNESLIVRNIVSAAAFLVIATLAILLIVSMRNAKRQEGLLMNRINEADERLRQLQSDRRTYLSLAFSTLEGLKEFNRYAHRKLTAGQAKDLFKDLESGSFVQTQADRFFEDFDAMFLKSEPHFLDSLNELLRPDQKLELMPGNRLSPEIRIAALMSLGVSDSSRIAAVLGLSLNTVYTYRNRLKGRASDRAKFENRLMKISDNT